MCHVIQCDIVYYHYVTKYDVIIIWKMLQICTCRYGRAILAIVNLWQSEARGKLLGYCLLTGNLRLVLPQKKL